MTVLNDLDRFHLVMDTIDRVPKRLQRRALKLELQRKLAEHKQYIETHGEDLPEIRNWQWGSPPEYGDGKAYAQEKPRAWRGSRLSRSRLRVDYFLDSPLTSTSTRRFGCRHAISSLRFF
jgi:hypothetical protein